MRPVAEDITVIVPTLGRSLLRDCLRSILAGSTWPVRLIVIDQGASAVAAAWIEEAREEGLNAEYVASEQVGAAAGRNRAIERVSSRFIAATDDDCRVATEWLFHMAARLRQHPGALVTGRVDELAAAKGDARAPSLITADAETIHTRPLLTAVVAAPQNGSSNPIVGTCAP